MPSNPVHQNHLLVFKTHIAAFNLPVISYGWLLEFPSAWAVCPMHISSVCITPCDLPGLKHHCSLPVLDVGVPPSQTVQWAAQLASAKGPAGIAGTQQAKVFISLPFPSRLPNHKTCWTFSWWLMSDLLSLPQTAAIEICTGICNTGAPSQLGTAGPATGPISETQ